MRCGGAAEAIVKHLSKTRAVSCQWVSILILVGLNKQSEGGDRNETPVEETEVEIGETIAA